MTECVLATDIGTSSIKAELIDAKGGIHHLSRFFFSSDLTASEWVSAFENIFKSVCDFVSTRRRLKISAICISGNGPSLVAVLEKEPDKLFLWNEPFDEPLDFKSPSIFLPRFEAFKKKYYQEFLKAKLFLSGPEYLIYKLTGTAFTILPEPRYLPAFWTENQIQSLGYDLEKIPKFVKPGDFAGLYRDIPVYYGAPDFLSALIGTNTLTAGKGCDRAGTSEGLNICLDFKPEIKEKNMRVLPSIINPLWNISYIIDNSGKRFYDYIKASGKNFLDFNKTVKSLLEIPISKNRNYENSSLGKGKKLIEDLAFELRSYFDKLEGYTNYKPSYTVSGGQAENELWTQLKADITGRTFVLTKTPNAELMGNSIIAFTAMGFFSSINQASNSMVKEKKVFSPNPKNFKIYSEIYFEICENKNKKKTKEDNNASSF